MAGTLEYMAPEVLLKRPASQASDVYGLAITINELATGAMQYCCYFTASDTDYIATSIASQASDVYGLAITINELATGALQLLVLFFV
jgi:serine/threonine protein kinase